MPTVPHVPPADRLFARVEVFQVACPHCGRVIVSNEDSPQRLQARIAKGLPIPKNRKRARKLSDADCLVYNPFTQRLRCPACDTCFVVGLILYPAPSGRYVTPEDVGTSYEGRLALRRLHLEQRRTAGAWYAEHRAAPGEAVNLYVPAGCSCPEKGWSARCPIHGKSDGGPTSDLGQSPPPVGGVKMSL